MALEFLIVILIVAVVGVVAGWIATQIFAKMSR